MRETILKEAREWICDTWGEGTYYHSLTDSGVQKVVNATYEGGWAAFIRDASSWASL